MAENKEEEDLSAVWAELDAASREFRRNTDSDPVDEWRTRHGRFSGSAVGHVCTNACILDPIAKDVFGCTLTGMIHLCGIDQCTASVLCGAGHFACGLTGYELDRVRVHEWSASIGCDMPTQGNAHAARSNISYKKKRHASARTRRSSCRDIITGAITKILKNPDESVLVKKKWHVILAGIRRSTRTYEQECVVNHELPNMAIVEDIAQRHMIRGRMWNRERCSDERLKFYVDTICALWETVVPIMAQTRTETHMKIFAIGCLYKIQHGFDVRGNRILPEDEWLTKNLPLACDIGSYGFPKRFVTVGRNTLLEAFKHLVLTNKLTRADLDVTRNTGRGGEAGATAGKA